MVIGAEVRVGADNLLPTSRLHDVRHVVHLDEVDGDPPGLVGLPESKSFRQCNMLVRDEECRA